MPIDIRATFLPDIQWRAKMFRHCFIMFQHEANGKASQQEANGK